MMFQFTGTPKSVILKQPFHLWMSCPNNDIQHAQKQYPVQRLSAVTNMQKKTEGKMGKNSENV